MSYPSWCINISTANNIREKQLFSINDEEYLVEYTKAMPIYNVYYYLLRNRRISTEKILIELFKKQFNINNHHETLKIVQRLGKQYRLQKGSWSIPKKHKPIIIRRYITRSLLLQAL